MVNCPLIRPYLLGGVALGGGYLRFPWIDQRNERNGAESQRGYWGFTPTFGGWAPRYRK